MADNRDHNNCIPGELHGSMYIFSSGNNTPGKHNYVDQLIRTVCPSWYLHLTPARTSYRLLQLKHMYVMSCIRTNCMGTFQRSNGSCTGM